MYIFFSSYLSAGEILGSDVIMWLLHILHHMQRQIHPTDKSDTYMSSLGLLLQHFYCKSSLSSAKHETVRQITHCEWPRGEQVSTGLRVKVIQKSPWRDARVSHLKRVAEGDWRTAALYDSHFVPLLWSWQICDVICSIRVAALFFCN